MGSDADELRQRAADHRVKAVELRAKAEAFITHRDDLMKLARDYELMAFDLDDLAQQKTDLLGSRRA